MTGRQEQTLGQGDAAAVMSRPWRTVVHDDPVNLMSYVEWVFRNYFSFDAATARAKMLEVHNRGRSVVAEGSRDMMETHVQAMHSYGLQASLEGGDDQ